MMSGWVEISVGSGYSIQCEDYSWDFDDDITAMDYPSDGHFGFSLLTISRTVRIKNAYFTSQSDLEDFISDLLTSQQSGSYNLKIKTKSNGTYIKWDGSNSTMPVLLKSMKDIRKMVRGDGEIWVIGRMEFKQAGDLST
ncbi:MAG: hypothetical protein ACTSUK_03910 [Promethearchaeota archaeon]